jgi:glutamate-1-semialdehyde 2,1-aminomutase
MQHLYAQACAVIAGGVNSPARAFHAVGGTPVFMHRAEGAYMWDVAGVRYIDYIAGYGPTILGHGHPAITAAITAAAHTGVLFGTPHVHEITFAHLLREAIPSMDVVRITSTGTEAVMSAIRLARTATKRRTIVKCSGCYHGHADSVLASAGSGVASVGIEHTAQDVISVPFNDAAAFVRTLSAHKNDIAAVIVEPIVGNFGIVPPQPGYMALLRAWTADIGALLLFDEVISAFRFHWGGAQTYWDVAITPDVTILGKIIGGGLPIGAYGGRADVMALVAPSGPMYQAGTHAANPLSVQAGIACIQALRDASHYTHMTARATSLADGIARRAQHYGIPVTVQRVGGAFSVHFCDHPITNFEDAKKVDKKKFATFFHGLLARGVAIAPSIYEAWFVSAAHTDEDVAHTLEAVDDVWRAW